ncbi:hypothetical protein Tco_1521030 [Tanacetum coccineum]
MHPYSLKVFLTKKGNDHLNVALSFYTSGGTSKKEALAEVGTTPKILKRWNNKVQEYVQSRSALVRLPAFAMLQ